MDSFFSAGELIQALDTMTGVWRVAKVLSISNQNVELEFPEFPKQKIRNVGETIIAGAHRDTWPIRKPVPTPELPPRRTTCAASRLGYEPENRVLADPVSIFSVPDSNCSLI